MRSESGQTLGTLVSLDSADGLWPLAAPADRGDRQQRCAQLRLGVDGTLYLSIARRYATSSY